MPQFMINRSTTYNALSDFTKGYVEAAFFTNGDFGDENENHLNEMGTERLTKAYLQDKADKARAAIVFASPGADLSFARATLAAAEIKLATLESE